MRTSVAVVVFAVALPAAVRAQDFGREWLDRVTHEVQTERGPLGTKPVEWHVVGGVEYYHDDNIFLADQNEIDDSIIIPFAGASIEYSESRFEVKAEFLGNYKVYSDSDLEDADDDEQRFYFKFRQVGAKYSLEVTEILTHLSDPLDVVFLDRAVRWVSMTVPRLAMDVSPKVGAELAANIGLVRYEDSVLSDAIDNDNIRVDGTLVYRGPWGMDFLAQGGWQEINYVASQAQGAPPDAWGYYVRGGVRGEVLPTLMLEVLAGGSHIESDFYSGTRIDEEDEGGDVSVDVRWEALPTLTLMADYSRQFTFAGGVDPYQTINRALFLGALELTQYVTVRGRFQYDHSHTTSGTERDYWSTGGSVTVKPLPWALIDGGVTFRSGEAENGPLTSEYDNLIFHVGVALTY
jgi:hypothetical protein